MFAECTGFKIINHNALIPVPTVKGQYYRTFRGCSRIYTFEANAGRPVIPSANYTENMDYFTQMFLNCYYIKVNKDITGSWYQFIDSDCTGLSGNVSGMLSGTGGSFTSDPVDGDAYI